MFTVSANANHIVIADCAEFGMILEIRPIEDGFIGFVSDEDGERISATPIVGSTPNSILEHANRMVDL